MVKPSVFEHRSIAGALCLCTKCVNARHYNLMKLLEEQRKERNIKHENL